MKRLLLTIVVLLLAGRAYAQTEELKGFQWGLAYKQEIALPDRQASANVTAGYRFNRGNYLGFQTGYVFVGSTREFGGSRRTWRIPLLVDYIHYFPIHKKQNSFFTGVEGGGFLTCFYNDYAQKTVTSLDYYACVKNGFDFNIADFTHLQLALLLSYPGIGFSIGFTF